jgi:hypothetical protein
LSKFEADGLRLRLAGGLGDDALIVEAEIGATPQT